MNSCIENIINEELLRETNQPVFHPSSMGGYYTYNNEPNYYEVRGDSQNNQQVPQNNLNTANNQQTGQVINQVQNNDTLGTANNQNQYNNEIGQKLSQYIKLFDSSNNKLSAVKQIINTEGNADSDTIRALLDYEDFADYYDANNLISCFYKYGNSKIGRETFMSDAMDAVMTNEIPSKVFVICQSDKAFSSTYKEVQSKEPSMVSQLLSHIQVDSQNAMGRAWNDGVVGMLDWMFDYSPNTLTDSKDKIEDFVKNPVNGNTSLHDAIEAPYLPVWKAQTGVGVAKGTKSIVKAIDKRVLGSAINNRVVQPVSSTKVAQLMSKAGLNAKNELQIAKNTLLKTSVKMVGKSASKVLLRAIPYVGVALLVYDGVNLLWYIATGEECTIDNVLKKFSNYTTTTKPQTQYIQRPAKTTATQRNDGSGLYDYSFRTANDRIPAIKQNMNSRPKPAPKKQRQLTQADIDNMLWKKPNNNSITNPYNPINNQGDQWNSQLRQGYKK